jgi:UDP-glucose 4-epimerase
VKGPVLVTGAAGFLGVPLVDALVDRGAEVVGLDRGQHERLRPRAEVSLEHADLRDAEAVRTVVERVQPWAVVHLAALHFIPYCVAHPAETLAVNVVGTQNLLDALAGTPVERIVFPSSGDVYAPSERSHGEGAPLSPVNVYGASKLMGELLLRFHLEAHPGPSARVLRLFNVYGPGETNPHLLAAMLAAMRDSDELRLGNLETARDYVYLYDAVAALMALLEREGGHEIVNVGTGVGTKGTRLVELLKGRTARPLRVTVDPERVRPVDRPRLVADTTRLRELLPGLELTPLDEGLRRTLEAEGLSS